MIIYKIFKSDECKGGEARWIVRIGRRSGGRHGGSPKGIHESDGLDVEAVGGTEEVQKGFADAADWTLK